MSLFSATTIGSWTVSSWVALDRVARHSGRAHRCQFTMLSSVWGHDWRGAPIGESSALEGNDGGRIRDLPSSSEQWCVVELPENWTREQLLPLQSLRDRWFDTLEDARAELTGRLDGLSGKTP
ncbi:MAG: hypothetical protein CL482_04150 [Acidobacteria bacterium]|nr:hypothetical protein [Acidobacteriota bacterium]